MNYFDPEYGQKRLKEITNSKVILRDYSKIEHCKDKYPIWGVSILCYIDKYSLSIDINYLPSGVVKFKIGNEYITTLETSYKKEELTEYVFDFFFDIVKKVLYDFESTNNLVSKFSYNRYWIDREVKLSKI